MLCCRSSLNKEMKVNPMPSENRFLQFCKNFITVVKIMDNNEIANFSAKELLALVGSFFSHFFGAPSYGVPIKLLLSVCLSVCPPICLSVCLSVQYFSQEWLSIFFLFLADSR